MPPQTHENVAGTPKLLDDESNNDAELAYAEPAMQPTASQDLVDLERDIARRRHCDDDDDEDYRSNECSEADQDKDDDVVRRPRRKRRRVSAATGRMVPQQRTHPDRSDSPSRQARKSPRRPRRWGKRGAPYPASSQQSILESESETDSAPMAKFEEWSLASPLTRYNRRFAAHFYVAVHLGPMCKARNGASGDGESKLRFLSQEAPPSETEHTDHEGRERPSRLEADFKEGEIHARGRCENPSAEEGARTVLDCDRQAFPGAYRRSHMRGVIDDAGEEEEWEVEEICGDKKLDDGGVELLVKWKGGEETWEP
ncbi:hypothetical protein C8A03DRAFT_39470 [Achaetomium macrosporum]|uniref:Chromo domain-containing protein n=1 Tax=Achaetomium macrosporum TaxID=79813 RepID=A0AAN7H2Z5_9PEZI|nr:hypothetical protein C8A03DRAFT_39470 [Achaetomium macrosporum]